LPDQQKGRRKSEKAAALATELGWGQSTGGHYF